MLTNKPRAFGQAHEGSQSFGTNSANSYSSWCPLHSMGGPRDLESVFAGAVGPAVQAGAARSSEHPCALSEVGRKRDAELPV